MGYPVNEAKLAIAFSKTPLPADFTLVAESNESNVIFHGKTKPVTNAAWGQFACHAELDFSSVHTPGTFVLKVGEAKSLPLHIGMRRIMENCRSSCWNSCVSNGAVIIRGSARIVINSMAARLMVRKPTAHRWTQPVAGMTPAIC